MTEDWIPHVRELVNSYFVPVLKPWEDAWYADQFDPPELIYHYTSAEGLRGMVETSSLWATHVLFLNDTREQYHPDELIRSLLGEIAAIRKNDWMDAFCNYIMSTPVLYYPPFTSFNVFVSCFCSDGDLLSQWRGYAGGMGGYAVGIDTFLLRHSIGWPVILRKVIYDADIQRCLVHDLLSAIADALEQMASHESLEIIPLCMKFMMARFWNVALQCVFCFKESGFREENEWRVICTQPADPGIAENLSPGLGRGRTVQYRSQKGLIVPYLELELPSLDAIQDGPKGVRSHYSFKEVIVGPSRNPELASRSVQMLLESNGYAESLTKVRASNLPLRG